MRRSRKLPTALIAAAFILSTAVNTQAASTKTGNSKATQSKAASKKRKLPGNLVERPASKKHPMTAAERKAFGSPLPMLKFEQVARLEFTQRVRYIRTLRSTFTKIEEIQNVYKSSLNASLDPKLLKQKDELYALIFGQFTYAQNPTDGGQGQSATDKCIYAYYLKNYPQPSSGIQPYKCIRTQCPNNPSGALCNPVISGLGLGRENEQMCVPAQRSWDATNQCDRERDQRIQRQGSAAIAKIINDARSHFQFIAPGQVTREHLLSEKSAGYISNLADLAYDDRAYAALIEVLSFYKANGLQLPSQLGELADRLSPTKIALDFDQLESGLNSIFRDLVAHCGDDVETPPRENLRRRLALLSQYAENEPPEDYTLSTWKQERRRLEAIQKLDSEKAPNSEYTIRNVIEIEECRAVDSRVNNIRAELRKIVGSYPTVVGDVPPSQPGSPPAIEIEQPPVGNWRSEPNATGCSADVTYEIHHLYSDAARCMVCLAEKSGQRAQTRQPQANGGYAVSTKWLSLLSTMAKACGDGVLNNKYLDMQTMLRYNQTFGDCSTDTYDWDLSAPLSSDDKNLIKTWSDEGFWSGQPTGFWRTLFSKNSLPDMNEEFKRVYGVSYLDASRIFCDPNTFKNSVFNVEGFLDGDEGLLEGKIRKYDPKHIDNLRSRSDAKRSCVGSRFGRAQMKSFLTSMTKEPVTRIHNRIKNTETGKKLFACMQESLANAEARYSGDNSRRTCQKMQNFDSNSYAAYQKTVEDVTKAGGASIISGGKYNGSCFVSRQYELEYAIDAQGRYQHSSDGKLVHTGFSTIGYSDPGPRGESADLLSPATPSTYGESIFMSTDGLRATHAPTINLLSRSNTASPLYGKEPYEASDYWFSSPTDDACEEFSEPLPQHEFGNNWEYDEKASGCSDAGYVSPASRMGEPTRQIK